MANNIMDSYTPILFIWKVFKSSLASSTMDQKAINSNVSIFK